MFAAEARRGRTVRRRERCMVGLGVWEVFTSLFKWRLSWVIADHAGDCELYIPLGKALSGML